MERDRSRLGRVAPAPPLRSPAQLAALAAHGMPCEEIFAEKVSTRMRVRPKFEATLDAAGQIKVHASHCRVVFTVYEMERLGRDPAERPAPAVNLTAQGIALERLAGSLTSAIGRRAA